MFFTRARALAGGGGLVSTTAANTAAVTKTISPCTSRLSSTAAPGPTEGWTPDACSRGFVRARLTPASRSAANNSAIFQISACPYEVDQSVAKVGSSSSAEPIPVPISTSTEQKATAEKRGTTYASEAT